MTAQYTKMKGEELIKKLLAGERDFQRIELERGFNLSGHEDYSELQSFLTQQNLRKEPIMFNNSTLVGLNATEIHLPYVQAQGVALQEAYLREAKLQGADFRQASLQGADFQGAALQQASLQGAYLQGADLQRTNLMEANLREADITKAKLDENIILYYTLFRFTKVTKDQAKFIDKLAPPDKRFNII